MKVNTLVTNLAKKAGQDISTDEFKKFIEAIPADLEMPDTIASGIDNSLLSITDARNNHPDIKNHYTAQTLATVDSTLDTLMDEAGLDDAAKKEIKDVKSTFQRIGLVQKKLVESLNSKNGSNKNATQQEIDRLQADLRSAKTEYQKLIDAHADQMKGIKIRAKLDGIAGKGVLPTKFDDLDPELRSASIEAAINRELQEKGAKWDIDANGNLVIIKGDGTTFYSENHQPITPKSFVESTLTRNKIIAAANTSVASNGNNSNLPTNANANAAAAGKNPAQTSVANYNADRLKRLEEATKQQQQLSV